MAIWAEIKKAINSNLNLPLDNKIDKDIEDNRLGKGFTTISEYRTTNTLSKLTVTNEYLSGYCIRKINDKYYLWGNVSNGIIFVTDDLFNTPFTEITTVTNDSQFTGSYSIGFTFKNNIYMAGGNSSYQNRLYKFNMITNKWERQSDLPFQLAENTRNSNGVEFNDKVFIWDNKAKTPRCWDGVSWSTVGYDKLTPDNYTNVGNATLSRCGDELVLSYSSVNSKDLNYQYVNCLIYDPSKNKFVKNDSIESKKIDQPVTNATDFGIPGIFFKLEEDWFCIANNKLYRIQDNKWSAWSSNIFYDFNFGKHDGTIDIVEIAEDKIVCVVSNRCFVIPNPISSITLTDIAPKNAKIVFINYDITSENFSLPIKNCEKLSKNSFRVLNDGEYEIRFLNSPFLYTTRIIR